MITRVLLHSSYCILAPGPVLNIYDCLGQVKLPIRQVNLGFKPLLKKCKILEVILDMSSPRAIHMLPSQLRILTKTCMYYCPTDCHSRSRGDPAGVWYEERRIPGKLTHWTLGDAAVILKLWSLNTCYGFMNTSHEIALWWMAQNTCDDKSTLAQVMAWCHQATSHYLNQCWPRYM